MMGLVLGYVRHLSPIQSYSASLFSVTSSSRPSTDVMASASSREIFPVIHTLLMCVHYVVQSCAQRIFGVVETLGSETAVSILSSTSIDLAGMCKGI